jgi:excisionase family DNA binding protein
MSDLMTVLELAEFLRVNPATIYRLLRDGQIPGFRVGSEWRFEREAIERWQQREVKRMTPEERSEAAAKSVRSQWERLTPEERSAEMKRRAAMRKKEK